MLGTPVKPYSKRGIAAFLLLSLIPAYPSAASAPGSSSAIFPAQEARLVRAQVDRTLGGTATGRVIFVDTASARLFMIEDGQVVDWMRVVVGKPGFSTPNVTGKVHYATLNPYWHVPPHITRGTIAPNVVKQGSSYLRRNGYEVVSGFTNDATVLPPEKVDWKAVASGRAAAYVRQLPGPANSMGKIKFGFDNPDGIYLHDSPARDLFARDRRYFSNGCVRLEDAPRLARWLMGRNPPPQTSKPEQHVLLPEAAAIVIAPLKADSGNQVAALQ
jgi:murein L,D-transpeptidase YcbB/YkuD